MNSAEIDLLDFIKRLALSYKTIIFFIFISIAIGYITYDRNDVTVSIHAFMITTEFMTESL